MYCIESYGEMMNVQSSYMFYHLFKLTNVYFIFVLVHELCTAVSIFHIRFISEKWNHCQKVKFLK